MPDKRDCQVTHTDHQEGLEELKQRHHQFYQTLTQCIDKDEE